MPFQRTQRFRPTCCQKQRRAAEAGPLDVQVGLSMQWSKLKSRVKDFIHPELRDRIDFYLTSYRESHDGADKVWITVDGRRVFSCRHYPREWAEAEAFNNGLRGERVKSILRQQEIHGPADFGNAMRDYLGKSIKDALVSLDPLIRAFALVDRRVGTRALAKIQIAASDHTLVKAFYELRRPSVHISPKEPPRPRGARKEKSWG
jgi:hypothetical protein